jgi:UDP-N-acetylglucosamine--dolichyl-phosphate N-acetylglucosaminephosphotransferase
MTTIDFTSLTTASLIFIISLFAILTATPILIKLLKKLGALVQDYHKPGKPLVPKPGGPSIIISLILGELVLYSLTGNLAALVLIAVTIIAGTVGIIDDVFTLGGILKPALIITAALPILLIGTYNFHPEFPFFGGVRLSIVYPLLIILAIPVTANTINTIDVLNGSVSGFIAIVSVPVIFSLLLKNDFSSMLATLPLLAVSIGFFIFHKYPSKIFPGDSGSLSLGAFYGAIVIIGGVELVGIIALLPAILNSFFFLSSVRRLAEHREIKDRPVKILSDGRLAASRSGSAPITLVRMILAKGPLSENEVVLNIYLVTIFSASLAIITAILTWGY